MKAAIFILVQLIILLDFMMTISSHITLAANAKGTTNTITYSYTGAAQYFTVPLNVYSVSVTLNGAGGGINYCDGNNIAGYGGIVQAYLTVTPQSTLCIRVGRYVKLFMYY